MCTRTGPYVVTYMMLIIMLIMLYDVILKNLKKPVNAHMHMNGLVCRLALSRVLRRLLWLLERVMGPRSLKMTEDGPKMAPRWP